jgi:[ribosomal protein S18]-alanine N-acetyltransferase
VATVRSEVALPEFTLRQMTEDDIAGVVALERAAYRFPWSEGIFRDCLRVGYVCRVIELAGALVGYGIMSMGAGEAHILNVCVREDLRCRGLGRRMLEYLLDRAHGSGMLEAFLEVRPSNVVAIRLYQALGFEQVGVRRGYYQAPGGREDAAVLRLDLSTRAASMRGK